jgi:hypothetical protein
VIFRHAILLFPYTNTETKPNAQNQVLDFDFSSPNIAVARGAWQRCSYTLNYVFVVVRGVCVCVIVLLHVYVYVYVYVYVLLYYCMCSTY